MLGDLDMHHEFMTRYLTTTFFSSQIIHFTVWGYLSFNMFIEFCKIILTGKEYFMDKPNHQECKELSEHEKFILSQMVNSDAKTIEEIGLMHQKQLAEIFQRKLNTQN